VFGLARNARLQRPARCFRELRYRTGQTWSRTRRVIGKAEHTGDKANPRFLVTSLSAKVWPPKTL
jgi:Transposase DDE domain group 1